MHDARCGYAPAPGGSGGRPWVGGMIKTFLRALLASALAISAAACGPTLKELPQANFSKYEVEAATPGEASIRGSDSGNTGLRGLSSRKVYVAAIDGKTSFDKDSLTAPMPTSAGPHSLTLVYRINDKRG